MCQASYNEFNFLFLLSPMEECKTNRRLSSYCKIYNLFGEDMHRKISPTRSRDFCFFGSVLHFQGQVQVLLHSSDSINICWIKEIVGMVIIWQVGKKTDPTCSEFTWVQDDKKNPEVGSLSKTQLHFEQGFEVWWMGHGLWTKKPQSGWEEKEFCTKEIKSL